MMDNAEGRGGNHTVARQGNIDNNPRRQYKIATDDANPFSTDSATAMDYQVQLDVFHGPLDLLLYLVKRHELDMFDIPMARITEQYLQYLELMQKIDMEVAGEFLVVAS